MLARYYVSTINDNEKLVNTRLLSQSNYSGTLSTVNFIDNETIEISIPTTNSVNGFRCFVYIKYNMVGGRYTDIDKIYSGSEIVVSNQYFSVIRLKVDWKYTSFMYFLNNTRSLNLIVERQSSLSYQTGRNQKDPELEKIVGNNRLFEQPYYDNSSNGRLTTITYLHCSKCNLGIWYVFSAKGHIYLVPQLASYDLENEIDNNSMRKTYAITNNITHQNIDFYLNETIVTDPGFLGKFYGPNPAWVWNKMQRVWDPDTAWLSYGFYGIDYRQPLQPNIRTNLSLSINCSNNSTNNPEIQQYQSFGLTQDNQMKIQNYTSANGEYYFYVEYVVWSPNGFIITTTPTIGNTSHKLNTLTRAITLGGQLPTSSDQYQRWLNENQASLSQSRTQATVSNTLKIVASTLSMIGGLIVTAATLGSGSFLGGAMFLGGLAGTIGGSVGIGIDNAKIDASMKDAEQQNKDQPHMVGSEWAIRIADLFLDNMGVWKIYKYSLPSYILNAMNNYLINNGMYCPNLLMTISFSTSMKAVYKIMDNDYNRNVISALSLSSNSQNVPELTIKKNIYKYLTNGVKFI